MLGRLQKSSKSLTFHWHCSIQKCTCCTCLQACGPCVVFWKRQLVQHSPLMRGLLACLCTPYMWWQWLNKLDLCACLVMREVEYNWSAWYLPMSKMQWGKLGKAARMLGSWPSLNKMHELQKPQSVFKNFKVLRVLLIKYNYTVYHCRVPTHFRLQGQFDLFLATVAAQEIKPDAIPHSSFCCKSLSGAVLAPVGLWGARLWYLWHLCTVILAILCKFYVILCNSLRYTSDLFLGEWVASRLGCRPWTCSGLLERESGGTWKGK